MWGWLLTQSTQLTLLSVSCYDFQMSNPMARYVREILSNSNTIKNEQGLINKSYEFKKQRAIY